MFDEIMNRLKSIRRSETIILGELMKKFLQFIPTNYIKSKTTPLKYLIHSKTYSTICLRRGVNILKLGIWGLDQGLDRFHLFSNFNDIK